MSTYLAASAVAERSELYRTYPIAASMREQNIDAPQRHALLKALADVKFNSILDIGCSTGYMLRAIQDRFAHVDAVGVDFNTAAIAWARRQDQRAWYLQRDAERVGELFGAGTFDVIYTCGVLMHMGPMLFAKVCKDIAALKPSCVFHVEIQGDEKLLTTRGDVVHFKRQHDYVGVYSAIGGWDVTCEPCYGDLSLITMRRAA